MIISMKPQPPYPKYPEYMNGRLKKVDMESRLLKIKKGIDDKQWYPKWTNKERWAAQQALNCALEILDEVEKKINKPVFSSNQTLIWDTIRSVGYKSSVTGYGKLLRN